MQFYIGSKQVPYRGYKFVSSFSQITSYLDIETTTVISDQITLTEGDSIIPFTPVMSFVNGSIVTTRFYPSSFYNLRTQVYNPVRGYFTVKSLLAKQGITLVGDSTKTQYWELPTLTLRVFMKTLRDYAILSTGGFVCTFLIDGSLFACDLDTVFKKPPKTTFVGTVESFTQDYTWMYHTPSISTFTTDSLQQTLTTPINLNENLSTKQHYKFVTNSQSESLQERYYTNAFYRAFYTSTQLKIQSGIFNTSLLGTTVKVNRDNSTYIIMSAESHDSGMTVFQLARP